MGTGAKRLTPCCLPASAPGGEASSSGGYLSTLVPRSLAKQNSFILFLLNVEAIICTGTTCRTDAVLGLFWHAPGWRKAGLPIPHHPDWPSLQWCRINEDRRACRMQTGLSNFPLNVVAILCIQQFHMLSMQCICSACRCGIHIAEGAKFCRQADQSLGANCLV